MAEFHFVRPFWLLLLPVGIWLVWRLARGTATAGRWQTWVDEALQPLVLTAADSALRGNRWLLCGAATACALAILALAGPTWERMPVPALRSSEALVMVLDLSRSMDAGDRGTKSAGAGQAEAVVALAAARQRTVRSCGVFGTRLYGDSADDGYPDHRRACVESFQRHHAEPRKLSGGGNQPCRTASAPGRSQPRGNTAGQRLRGVTGCHGNSPASCVAKA